MSAHTSNAAKLLLRDIYQRCADCALRSPSLMHKTSQCYHYRHPCKKSLIMPWKKKTIATGAPPPNCVLGLAPKQVALAQGPWKQNRWGEAEEIIKELKKECQASNIRDRSQNGASEVRESTQRFSLTLSAAFCLCEERGMIKKAPLAVITHSCQLQLFLLEGNILAAFLIPVILNKREESTQQASFTTLSQREVALVRLKRQETSGWCQSFN